MEKVVSKDGTEIAYDQTGKGPAIILVGGALAQRANPDVKSLAALLAPHFTAIIYDRRGRGDSGDTAPYAVEREVEDIEALIDKAGGSAFVFGHSSGAALALEAARRLDGKIKKLALYEPPFLIAKSDQQLVNHLVQLKKMLAAGRRGEMIEYWMTAIIGMPAEAVAPMKGSPMWQELMSVAPTVVYDLTIMRNYSDPARRIAGITMPTLAMDGGASPAWAAEAAQTLVEAIPKTQRRTLAGQTHGAAPEVLAPVLVEFCEA